MKIIGINGFKRVGKGETAGAIARNYPGVVREEGFAWRMKALGMQSLGFDRSLEELVELADSLKVNGEITVDYFEPEDTPRNEFSHLHEQTGRGFQQQLGTRGREILGEDVWVNLVLPTVEFLPDVPSDLRERAEQIAFQNRLEHRYPGVDLLVLSDLRFENEAERVLALGGEVWEIVRPGTGSDGHASEQTLPRRLVTRQIVNDGTLAELEDKVAVALVEVSA